MSELKSERVAIPVSVGTLNFFECGPNSANVYMSDPKDGMIFLAVKIDGKPWESRTTDDKGRKLQIERKGPDGVKEKIDKLPSQVFATTGGAVKLNAANQMISVNCYIPANYGKVERIKRDSQTVKDAFKGWKTE